MRIQESDIRITSQHEQEYRHEVNIQGQTSFRDVFQDLSLAGVETAKGEREQVLQLLQTLIDAILAAVDGKKCRSENDDCCDLLLMPQQSDREEAWTWQSVEEISVHERTRGEGEGSIPTTGGKDIDFKRRDSPPMPLLVRRELAWNWKTVEKISEHERTQVEGGGTIRTADGKNIDFKLNLDLCRDYNCVRNYTGSSKLVLHDPLVINFDGKSAQLSGQRFDFDLDSDGKLEAVPSLAAGSGFLVLDRNGNGQVDNGKDLFGAATGDGFAELSALDHDGNGWLDEADPDFAKLRVWRGNKDLASLAEAGVGALWLGSTSSPFALKDSANQLLGEIKATGLYLSEDGRVGSLQQVDLALKPDTDGAGTQSPGLG